jgi:hypothetical protein
LLEYLDIAWINKSQKIRKHRDKPKKQTVLMMTLNIVQTLSPERFKRRFGLQRNTFKKMGIVLLPLLRSISICGAKPKLTLPEQVLVALGKAPCAGVAQPFTIEISSSANSKHQRMVTEAPVKAKYEAVIGLETHCQHSH